MNITEYNKADKMSEGKEVTDIKVSKEKKLQKPKVKKPKSHSILKVKVTGNPGVVNKPKSKNKSKSPTKIMINSEPKKNMIQSDNNEEVINSIKEVAETSDLKMNCNLPQENIISTDSLEKLDFAEGLEAATLPSSESNKTSPELKGESNEIGNDIDLYNIIKNNPAKVQNILKSLKGPCKKSTPRVQKGSAVKQNVISNNSVNSTPRRRRTKSVPLTATDRMSRSAAAALKTEQSKEEDPEKKEFLMNDLDVESGDLEKKEAELSNAVEINSKTSSEDKSYKDRNTSHVQNYRTDNIQILEYDGKDKGKSENLNSCVQEEKGNDRSISNTPPEKDKQNKVLKSFVIEKGVLAIEPNTCILNNKQSYEGAEKIKPKIKPGLFSNFKTSNLKFLANNENTESISDKSSVNVTNSFNVALVDSEHHLSEKLKILDIKNDEINKNNDEGTSKCPKLKEKYSVDATKISHNEGECINNTSLLNHSFNYLSDTSAKFIAVSSNEILSEPAKKHCQQINKESCYLSKVDCNQEQVETSASTSFSEDQNDVNDDRFTKVGLNKEKMPEQNVPQQRLGKKCKKVLDLLNIDSDASSDSGNFKRNGKLTNHIGNNKDISSDEEVLADSLEKFQSSSETMPEKYNEKSSPSEEDGASLFAEIEDESGVVEEVNGPISPEESLEEAFWDYESEEDEPAAKTTVNYTDESNPYVDNNFTNDESTTDNSFIYRDTDDQMSTDLSDENDYDDDDDDDNVGISINCEFDDSEKGFHFMEKINNVIKVPKYYVKRDPDPSEIIEVSEVENENEINADNRKKIGESLSRWESADFSSIVSFDIAQDILQNFCPYIFLDGVCKNVENNCVFSHKIPQEVLLEHPFEEVWIVLQFMLKQMIAKVNISHQFVESVILYLEEIITTNKEDINKIVERTLMVTAYIPFIEDNREVLWKMSLENLLKLGISRWIAIKQMFRFLITFFSKNLKQTKAIWEEMLHSLQVDKLPRKVWEVIECLVEPCDYVLPTKFLTAALVDVANYDSDYDEDGSDSENQFEEVNHRKTIMAYNLLVRQLLMTKPHKLSLIGQHELHVFLEKASAISELREPVSRIRKMITFGDHIIAKFPCRESFSDFNAENVNLSLKRSQSVSDIMELVKRKKYESEVSQKPVFEQQKMISALIRALEVTDLDAVIKVLRENANKVFYLNLVNQLFRHLNNMDAIPILNHLLCKINKDGSNEGLVVKRTLGRIVVTLMLQFVKITDWEKACTLLMLLHSYRLSPITLEALVGECSQVRKAVTCSEIHYHSGHYSSALKVLINYKLFKRESWKIKGDECDIVIVERIANYLLKKLIEKKEYEHAIILFKAIFQELGEDQGEIDLMNFYEELLHGLFEESEKYATTCIELYWFVNEEDPTIVLGAVTFRVLLILSYKLAKHEIAFEIFDKCMKNKIFPCFQEKERIIRLYKCFLEEEFEVYLIKWFTWFLKAKGVRSCPIKILFLNDSSEDLAMNSRFGMPPLLKQVDSSVKGAVIRVKNVLIEFCQCTSSLKFRVKKDGIILPAETTALILNSIIASRRIID